MKDLIDSGIDVSVATHLGDIDIATDVLNSSAWLIALSTAALYFCFQEMEKIESAVVSDWMRVVVYAYSLVGISLIFSFIAAYQVRKSHRQLTAYSRNMLCALKILRSELIDNQEKVEEFWKKNDKATPFWQHVYTGELYSIINPDMIGTIPKLDKRLAYWRKKIDAVSNLQRVSTFFGYLLLASLKLMTLFLNFAI